MSIAPLRLPFDLAEAVRDRGAAEPDWLREDRLTAARLAVSLPAEGNPLFTPYHDLRPVPLDAIRFVDGVSVSDHATSAAVPDGADGLVEVTGDTVTALALSDDARAAGVRVDTLDRAVAGDDDLRAVLGGGDTLSQDDAFGQVVRSASSVAAVVRVPAGVRLARPLVVRWRVGAPGTGLIGRSIILLDEGARASILEELVGPEDDPVAGTSGDAATRLWWGSSEVVLGAGATLDVAGIQELPADAAAFVSRHARIGDGATLRWALASVGARMQKSRIDNLLIGGGSRVDQAEIGFGDGAQVFDLTSYTRHIGEDTTGDLLSKGVFTDRARGYIKGLIDIQRTARGTDSFLGEFSMLLTRKARSVTVPSLEIDQPDVRRASHSSSVAPIDEGQIFYLMSRGLDRETARRTIVLGFLEPVVARIPLPEVQERLRGLLEEKWPAETARAA